MKTIFLMVLVLATSNAIAAKQMDCEYQYENKFGKVKRSFELMASRPEFSKSFRSHGFDMKIDQTGIHAEVFDGEVKKVATQSLKEPWDEKRDPKEIDFAFEFKSAKSQISCR